MPRRAHKYLLLAACLCAPGATRLLVRPTPPARMMLATPPSGVQVVGPSAMLTLQREGQVIFDARTQGRAIPGAARRFPEHISAAPLVVARNQGEAERWARARGWSGLVRWVPARLLETRVQRGVAQMEPGAVWQRAQRGQVVVIDVSEPGEWSVGHLPLSRRVDWKRIIAGDRSWLPRGRALRGKALVFT